MTFISYCDTAAYNIGGAAIVGTFLPDIAIYPSLRLSPQNAGQYPLTEDVKRPACHAQKRAYFCR